MEIELVGGVFVEANNKMKTFFKRSSVCMLGQL